MKFVIIGAGIVGLSIAETLIKKKIISPDNLIILDKYSVPSDGTSTHNSGVLHAGLYYKPGSLKANLSIDGGNKLKDWCFENDLPILKCGKLLVPFDQKDLIRLDEIFDNATENGCEVKKVDYSEAVKIQPGLTKQEKYLWSPNTAVFSPQLIMKRLFQLLKEKGVQFLKKGVILDDESNKRFLLDDKTYCYYSRYINCAGPGSLEIAKSISNKFDNLSILPFLGEYGVQTSGLKIETNLYPVPNPELPFLGTHLTPRINNSTLIGPNAIPVFRKDIQGFDLNEIKNFSSIIVNNLVLFASNLQNYREHAFSEFTINVRQKFHKNSIKYLEEQARKDFEIKMEKTTYGIRPQLIEKDSFKFVNDFLYERINNNLHIVNAVSPAFTSCFALAEYVANQI